MVKFNNMIPSILISSDVKTREDFLSDYCKKNEIYKSFIYRIEPDGKSIKIDQVRDLLSRASFSSAERRLFLVNGIDKATPEAQNALLKILEEPSRNDCYLLFADNGNNIIPTVRSRCHVISDSSQKVIFFDEEFVESFSNFLAGKENIFDLMSSKTLEKIGRDECLTLIRYLIIFFHNKGIIQMSDAMFTKRLLHVWYLLFNNNISPQLAVDGLLIYGREVYKK